MISIAQGFLSVVVIDSARTTWECVPDQQAMPARSPVSTSLTLIGNTPVVRLHHVVPDDCAQVFLKIESVNPSGSYKDRMAKSMIEEAECSGDLKPGMTVVKATGESTGSSLAFLCAVKGYQFHVVSSNAFEIEKLRTMSAFADNYYFTNQFINKVSLIGYETIDHELVEQFPQGIDAFWGAVGTAGMVMGVARVLKSKWTGTHIAVVEPAPSPTITENRPGPHSVEGIGIGYIPPHLD
ncbi:unnamed protein product [Penicillium nalgiovense]|nr:unnamed protein product [Penicillium nalgiovense]